MAIIEAMVVIIYVPINAGLIPPASKSSPGGFGSKVNSSGVIWDPPLIRIYVTRKIKGSIAINAQITDKEVKNLSPIFLDNLFW